MSGAKLTWLERRRARMAKEALRQQARQDREAREADQLAASMEVTALKEFGATYSKPFSEAGHCTVDRSAQEAEQLRVQTVVRRDKADRAEERDRKMAEMELAQGVFVNLADTVVSPTTEWLAKHETQVFTPKQPDGTARVIRTVRSVRTPMVDRLHRRGSLTDDQRAACEWYRDQFEAARLDGKFKSSAFSLVGNVGGTGPDRMPVTSDLEMGARRAIRAARAALEPREIKLIEAVVLDNMPVSKAWRYMEVKRKTIEERFREAAQKLVNHCENTDVELKNTPADSHGD